METNPPVESAYLIVDCPPGTGDEPLSVLQTLEKPDGALIVTTPQEVAAVDVRKSVTFCNSMNVPIAGIIENMSGFACPHCGTVTPIFKTGGGKAIAEKYGVRFLGAIPICPEVGAAGDNGDAFIRSHEDSPATKAFNPIINQFLIEHKTQKSVAEKTATIQ